MSQQGDASGQRREKEEKLERAESRVLSGIPSSSLVGKASIQQQSCQLQSQKLSRPFFETCQKPRSAKKDQAQNAGRHGTARVPNKRLSREHISMPMLSRITEPNTP